MSCRIVPPGKRLIFRKSRKTKDGKVIYAWQYNLKAFPILVDDESAPVGDSPSEEEAPAHDEP